MTDSGLVVVAPAFPAWMRRAIEDIDAVEQRRSAVPAAAKVAAAFGVPLWVVSGMPRPRYRPLAASWPGMARYRQRLAGRGRR